jgi:DNA-directed RNA polymerase specialized sigma24 family protein
MSTGPANPEPTLSTRWTRIGALHGSDAEHEWQWFVGRYRPFVRSVLASMLARPSDANAAEQEFWGYVFLSGALQRADRERRFRAFLSGIARNFARGWGRRRGVRVAEDAEVEALPARGGGLIEPWVDNVVGNALASLRSENGAMAGALARFYGLPAEGTPGRPMSAGEVAAATGTTAQGVYMLLFRGRKRMRQLIEAELREGCRDEEACAEELQALLGVAASRLPGLIGERG